MDRVQAAPCRRIARAILMALVVCSWTACGADKVSTTPTGYAGEWTGTTTQGTTISFSVSPTDTVTAITFDYNDVVSHCAGTVTLRSLALPIVTPEPLQPPPFGQPGFSYQTQAADGTRAIQIEAHFPDHRTASGQFLLFKYDDACMVTGGNWSATP